MLNDASPFTRCNAVYNSSTYFGAVLLGQVESYNLYIHPQYGIEVLNVDSTESFNHGFVKFSKALEEWLPCFKDKSKAASTTSE
jgi:hypothetical protein